MIKRIFLPQNENSNCKYFLEVDFENKILKVGGFSYEENILFPTKHMDLNKFFEFLGIDEKL